MKNIFDFTIYIAIGVLVWWFIFFKAFGFIGIHTPEHYHVTVRSLSTNEIIYDDLVADASRFTFGVGVKITEFDNDRLEIAGNATITRKTK
jgi:hypothetical protein